jgi:uncharacterized Zn finger protein
MVELGKHDAVVPLGRELIERGMRQIEESHDEGETAMALSECFPMVFKAVAASSLPAPQKLLFAIDARLRDDCDTLDTAPDIVLDGKYQPADWSAVADELACRLKSTPSGGDDFHRNYQRDGISTWMADALHNAGRGDEVLAIYESEARATGSYERLVQFLIQQKKYGDAERWAMEGIAKTRVKLPGVATNLAQALGETAKFRKQWAVVAAHAAWQFFLQPGVETFKQLTSAAAKAHCEEAVRQAALRFLETGVAPLPLTPTARAAEGQGAAGPDWPLPTPDYLRPLLETTARVRTPEGPHFEVLIDLAIAQKRPEDALKWYDKLTAERQGGGGRYGWSDPGDRLAAAVVASHPQRALEIYAQRVTANLREAHTAAYETVAGYLRQMRPIFKALDREGEWTQLLMEIRLKYRNRPRFMETLDRLDGRTILQSRRPRH